MIGHSRSSLSAASDETLATSDEWLSQVDAGYLLCSLFRFEMHQAPANERRLILLLPLALPTR